MPRLIWHFLQGGWYRFLVDAKINEIYFRVKNYELHPTNALATGVSEFSSRSVKMKSKSEEQEQKKEIIEEILDIEYNIKF